MSCCVDIEKTLALSYNVYSLRQIFELRHSPSPGFIRHKKTNENVEKDKVKEMLSQIEGSHVCLFLFV